MLKSIPFPLPSLFPFCTSLVPGLTGLPTCPVVAIWILPEKTWISAMKEFHLLAGSTVSLRQRRTYPHRLAAALPLMPSLAGVRLSLPAPRLQYTGNQITGTCLIGVLESRGGKILHHVAISKLYLN